MTPGIGLQRGRGDLSSGLSQPWGKKLLSNLAERALMLRYHLPDGRSWKRLGGMGGVLHDAVGFAGASCKENVQDGWERGTMIFAAVFTVRWRVLRSAALQFPYQNSDVAGQHTLNGAL